MTQESTPAEVYFDESGHDGENLIEGMTTVFAHGSIHIAKEEAEDLIEYIRSKTRTQAPELKASILYQGGESLIDHLYGPEGKLVGNVSVYLVEKENFAVGKIIDLLVEEAAYEQGINLYASGNARAMADDLYEYGPRALGKDGWNDLLSGFTSLMRAKQRKGREKETVDGFFEKIDSYRLISRRDKVTRILALVWATRSHAEEFQIDVANGTLVKALDPLQASLYQLAHWWHERLQRPIAVMHDAQTALTPQLQETILDVSNNGSPKEFNLPGTKFPLVSIEQLDSRTDPRIQLADITAGFARQIAENSLLGQANKERLVQLRRIMYPHPIWGPGRSWEEIRPDANAVKG